MFVLRFILAFLLCAISLERGVCQEPPQGVQVASSEDMPGNQRFDLTFATFKFLNAGNLDELEFTPKQVKEIRDILKRYLESMNAIPEKLAGMPDAAERQSAGSLLAKEARDQLQSKIDDNLSPDQTKELRTRVLGDFRKRATILELLQSPWVCTRLDISDEQLSRIVDRAEMEKINLKRKMAELLKKVEKEMLTELTDEQRQKLDEIVGR